MKKVAKTVVLLFMLICLFFLMSCEEQGDEPSNEKLLASTSSLGKSWQITRIEVALGSIDPFECVRDNNITYYPNGRYEMNEGPLKCDPSDLPALTGTWFLNAAGNQLTIELPDSLKVYTLDYIDASVHHITAEFPDGTRTYILSSQ